MIGKRSASASAARRSPARGRAQVVLDTNVLMLVVRGGFPLEAEVERTVPGAVIRVPASVLRELEGLGRSLTPGAIAARALADRYIVVPTTERGDEGVLEAARTTGGWVVTADRELRRRLGIRGVSVLVPRDRHRLEPIRGQPRPRPGGGSPSRREPGRGNG